MYPIGKAANNISFICKKYYIPVLLKELGLLIIVLHVFISSQKCVKYHLVQDL